MRLGKQLSKKVLRLVAICRFLINVKKVDKESATFSNPFDAGNFSATKKLLVVAHSLTAFSIFQKNSL